MIVVCGEIAYPEDFPQWRSMQYQWRGMVVNRQDMIGHLQGFNRYVRIEWFDKICMALKNIGELSSSCFAVNVGLHTSAQPTI